MSPVPGGTPPKKGSAIQRSSAAAILKSYAQRLSAYAESGRQELIEESKEFLRTISGELLNRATRVKVEMAANALEASVQRKVPVPEFRAALDELAPGLSSWGYCGACGEWGQRRGKRPNHKPKCPERAVDNPTPS